MDIVKLETQTIPMEQLVQLIALQLEKGGRSPLTVTGSSMMPMLYGRRDMVELIPPAHRQKKGDIILYRRKNSQYVLHRIIGLTADGYICCGDNQVSKEPVSQEQLIAVVNGFVRKGRTYSIDGLGYRFYRWLWVNLFFLRPGYIWLRRRLGRLRKQLRKKWGIWL